MRLQRSSAGARQVEHPVVGLDLRRVGRARPRLRPELRLGQHLVQQLDRELGGALVDRRRVVLGADRERALRCDRAGVELLHGLVDRDAGLGVAGHERALDRGGAAPARQQRRVHVQPERRARAASSGISSAVGGDDDRVRRRGRARRRAAPAGSTGIPSRSATTFAGGARDPPAAAARPVGPRQQVRDVVPRGEPLEHVGAERRRGGDGEPARSGRVPAAAAGARAPRWRASASSGRGSARRRGGRARAGRRARPGRRARARSGAPVASWPSTVTSTRAARPGTSTPCSERQPSSSLVRSPRALDDLAG